MSYHRYPMHPASGFQRNGNPNYRPQHHNPWHFQQRPIHFGGSEGAYGMHNPPLAAGYTPLPQPAQFVSCTGVPWAVGRHQHPRWAAPLPQVPRFEAGGVTTPTGAMNLPANQSRVRPGRGGFQGLGGQQRGMTSWDSISHGGASQSQVRPTKPNPSFRGGQNSRNKAKQAKKADKNLVSTTAPPEEHYDMDAIIRDQNWDKLQKAAKQMYPQPWSCLNEARLAGALTGRQSKYPARGYEFVSFLSICLKRYPVDKSLLDGCAGRLEKLLVDIYGHIKPALFNIYWTDLHPECAEVDAAIKEWCKAQAPHFPNLTVYVGLFLKDLSLVADVLGLLGKSKSVRKAFLQEVASRSLRDGEWPAMVNMMKVLSPDEMKAKEIRLPRAVTVLASCEEAGLDFWGVYLALDLRQWDVVNRILSSSQDGLVASYVLQWLQEHYSRNGWKIVDALIPKLSLDGLINLVECGFFVNEDYLCPEIVSIARQAIQSIDFSKIKEDAFHTLLNLCLKMSRVDCELCDPYYDVDLSSDNDSDPDQDDIEGQNKADNINDTNPSDKGKDSNPSEASSESDLRIWIGRSILQCYIQAGMMTCPIAKKALDHQMKYILGIDPPRPDDECWRCHTNGILGVEWVLRDLHRVGAFSSVALTQIKEHIDNADIDATKEGDYETNLPELRKAKEYLHSEGSSPLRLLDLCRQTVSVCIGVHPKREERIDSLPVSQPIKAFLHFNDLGLADLAMPKARSKTSEDSLSQISDSDFDFFDSDLEFSDDSSDWKWYWH